MNIRYEGTLATFTGFSQAVHDNLKALCKTPGDFKLDIRHLPDGETDGILPRYEPLLKLVDASPDEEWPDVWAVHTTPRGLKDHTPPAFKGLKRVAITAWETDKLQAIDVQSLNRFDKVIVPCYWNKETFEKSGVTAPVAVVPHTFDPEWWWWWKAPQATKIGPYTFYSIAVWNERKNPLGLLKAYLHAFTADDDVLLRILCPNPRVEEYELLLKLMALPNPPRVEFLGGGKRWVGEEEHRQFHYDGDCYVTLARGEGWGLGAFEAAIVGNPVIATNIGGHIDFLSAGRYTGLCRHLPVPFVWTPCVQARHGIDGTQSWAEPDLSFAALAMRHCAEARPAALSNQREGLVSDFGYATVGKMLLRELGEW